MIDTETIIIASLCLIILVLLKILSVKNREDFQVINDVPQKNKIEINYLKKYKQVKKVRKSTRNPSPKCGDNAREKWCNKNV